MLQSEVLINLNHLRSNFRFVSKKMNNKKIMAVVKGNAYGHGIDRVAKVLEEEGVFGFCVALEQEVRELLKLELSNPILHLGRIHSKMLDILDTGQVRCNITSIDDIDLLEEYGASKNIKINAHLKLDTGMTRLGIQEFEIDKCIQRLKNTQSINVEGLWSHLATADEIEDKFLFKQVERFKEYCDKIKNSIDSVEFAHIEPSGAILRYDNEYTNMVRPGISLYGATPFGKPSKDLKPVMEFRAPIALTKSIPASTDVGYNRTYTSDRSMKIGLVQGGYADGVPTSFSNKGTVAYGDKTVNIIGKVAFDLTTIDISSLDCRDFDYVTFWGGNNEEARIENVAMNCDRNPYELFTGISRRVKRIFIDD